jgi:hydrogenase maturation protein HypF
MHSQNTSMACKITVKGVVQGVGFRPFIYRIAKKNGLRGYVRNAGNSVELLVEGKDGQIRGFLEALRNEHPPLAEVFAVDATPVKNQDYMDFLILKSEAKGETGSAIPPDVALCDKCIQEIFDSDNRRYLYPFTVCTDCGPRFTIIEDLPYDREKTTMREFPMCGDCKREYWAPTDRRFHAEPTCCPKCGPQYALFKKDEKIKTDNPIREAAKALDAGKIVAIKGVGGTHLATKTTLDKPILRIRKMLGRPQKPFAIMARDMPTVNKIAYVGREEKRLLESFRRSIVLLRKKEGILSSYIAPKLYNIGVMLPYAGIHHLLFHYSQEPAFVMTSANIPGEPMAIDEEDILALKADYSLIHNRRIKNRCDDSVIKITADMGAFLRRSRGYVPQLIKLTIENDKNILALGAELDVTSCILKGKNALLSQYIGNTTKLRTLEYLEEAVYNLMALSKIRDIDAVAVDLHPNFSTARLGEEFSERMGAELIKIQHHHAHIASLMAENGIEEMVGIAIDGVGYGVDGKTWGGEILTADLHGFKRTGSLMPHLMPGGDLATRYPARMVAGILRKKYPLEELTDILIKNIIKGFRSAREVDIVLKQLERRFNTPETTSAGRVLDAVSALLGICYERTYEGEPAIKLESIATKGDVRVDIPVVVAEKKGRLELDTAEILDAVLHATRKHSKADIAASVQKALAQGLAKMAARIAEETELDTVGVSGGVAYNDSIVRTIREEIEENGLRFIANRKVPCGDGGLSLGQAAAASRLI